MLIIFSLHIKQVYSCETALLRVYTNNGTMLVLLELSTAFNTIEHDNLFCIHVKYGGIRGNALKLI